MLTYLIPCLVLPAVLVRVTASSGDYLLVHDVEYLGNDRFPEAIYVFYSYHGNNEKMTLERDDEATSMLSESLFEVSNLLPSGVFKDQNREEFSAYDSGNSNIIVVHRENKGAKPKFYGRFTYAGYKMTMHAVEGSHELHRAWREIDAASHHRSRRSASEPENVIELFIFSDLSILEHFEEELVAADESREFIRRWLPVVAKEVDVIFNYLYQYGTNETLRVYFQQYQIITETNHQKWVQNNLESDALTTSAVTDLQTYYDKLMTKFAFPYADHVMALTKLEMEGGLQVMTAGTICGSGSDIGTSIVRIDNFPVTVAQGIARSFSVPFDGNGNSCSKSDSYIMSTVYDGGTKAGQGNRWKFSPCSVTQLQSALDGSLDLSCLRVQDKYFDWESYEKFPLIGDLLTVDQQCALRYQSGATFCNIDGGGDTPDCYGSNQGCNVLGRCLPYSPAQHSPCGNDPDSREFGCQFGFCKAMDTTKFDSSTSTTSSTFLPTSTSSSTSLPTSTSSTSTSTTSIRSAEDALGTPVKPAANFVVSCVVKTSVQYYEIPGCPCSECMDQSDTGTCMETPDCPGKRVKVTTTYVRKDCASDYTAGPQTMIADVSDSQNLIAEVFKGETGNWEVELVTGP